MQGFTLKSEFESKTLFPSIEGFKTFVHARSGLTVHMATVFGPLHSMAVVVPTFSQDNKGLAHTLEHLIFTGSKKYPARGYLDKLATSCLSNGTNAYTSDDHTNYTFTCASKEGLLNLLPVFLDHILYPKIEQEAVDTEVFSLVEGAASSPTAQGVVYCEMKARQHSEADLLDLTLRQEFARRYASQHPGLKLLQWECGGLTWDIARLSRDEIIEFHQRYYRPSQMSIILSSAQCADADFVESILAAIDASVEDSMPHAAVDIAEVYDAVAESGSGASQLGHRVVNFPSDDDSMGSVGFAWPGPPARDLLRVLSFHVLFKFLRETSASPLQQEFVQVSEPWATDIDYEIKPYFQTIMTVLFSGVQKEQGALEAGMIKSRMMNCLQKAVEDPSFSNNIQLCLQSFWFKHVEQLEDDPHESILSYTIPNVTRAALGDSLQESFGENIGKLCAHYEEIRIKPEEYWKELLQELINSDPIEVLLHPDSKLSEKIEAEEEALLRELASTGKARVVPKAEVSGSDASKLTKQQTLYCMVPFKRCFEKGHIHCVEFPETRLKSFTSLTNFKAHIPQELWVYLPLFQELLFQCDLNIRGNERFLDLLDIFESELSDPKKIPYQLLQRSLTAFLNAYSIAFGMDNETFSVGYCDDAMVFTAHLMEASPVSLAECEYIFNFVIANTDISVERVKAVAGNMVNQIRDLQKDPYEVMDALLTGTLYEVSSPLNGDASKKTRCEETLVHFETEISMFRQRAFLGKALECEKTLREVVECLRKIQNTYMLMVRRAKSFVQLSGTSDYLEKELCRGEYGMKRFEPASKITDLSRLPRFGACEFSGGSRVLAFAKSEFTASYLSVVVPCPVLCALPGQLEASPEQLREYVAISLICQLLSVTEGPIYRRIRGRGLAYDASLTVSIWNGLLTLGVNDSVSPVESYKELQGLLREVDDECTEGAEEGKSVGIINEGSLERAKSALIYQIVEERSAPSGVATVAFRYLLRGIPMAQDLKVFDPVLAACKQVTISDVRDAWRRHFRSLLDPAGRGIVMLAVPKGAQSFIGELEEMLGVAVQVIDLKAKFGMESDSDAESEEGSGSGEESGSGSGTEGEGH